MATLLAASAVTAGSQPVWVQRANIGPAPRAEFGLAYDSSRGVTVLFGGAQNLSFTSVFPDTWEWDGNAGVWTLRANTGPIARCDHAMAYDSDRHVTVIFGGYNGTYLGDTWEWDGAPQPGTWTLRTSTGPTPRADSFMVYDSARQVMVLFGGQRINGTIAGETWEYNGAVTPPTWTLRSSSGPPPRWIQRMAYDSNRGVTVMFGGANAALQALADTWEWDGAPPQGTWTQRAGSGPSPRYGNAMAYDTHRQRSVIFGGGTTFTSGNDQTWEWDGQPKTGVWAQHAVSGPSARTFVKMAYDSARCRAVLFGGYGGGMFRGDTWEFGVIVTGDLTCDGVIDVNDLLEVINAWGTCASPPAECPADIDADGDVDVDDLLMVISNWG